jgi:hypothetical protein
VPRGRCSLPLRVGLTEVLGRTLQAMNEGQNTLELKESFDLLQHFLAFLFVF